MHRLFAFMYSVALIGSLSLPAARVAAENKLAASDIPGTPIGVGSLGGAAGGMIVDQVYAVEIPVQSVLVVSVSGEVGAELGLYLFGENSTSVLTDTPLVQSAKPGSRQTIVHSYVAPTRAYINVNGRNLDRPYAYTLQVTIIIDTSPPIFRELVVPATTKTAELCVYISASDPTSSVREVSVGEATNEPNWTPYLGPGEYCTALEPGPLKRRIQIVAKNGIGLVGGRNVTVTTDDYAPSLIRSTPTDEILLSNDAVITWRFDEPIFVAVTGQPLVKVETPDAEPIAGVTRLSLSRRTITWSPIRVIRPGSVILAALATLRDEAGNIRTADLTRIISRKNLPKLQLNLLSKNRGVARVELKVSRSLVGKELVIEGWDGTTWQSLSAFTPIGLTVRKWISTAKTVKIRARYSGSERLVAAESRALLFAP